MDVILTCPVNASEVIHWRRMCVDHVVIIMIGCLLVPLSVFGVLANLTTVIVLTRCKTLRTSINVILLSLSISDMMSAILSTLVVYGIFQGHVQGDYNGIVIFWCSFFVGAFGTSIVTGLHISFFACLRYISIKWPVSFRRIKPIHVKIFAISVWVIVMVAVLLILTLQLIGHITTNQGRDIARVYMVSILVLATYVTICSLAIGLEIFHRRRTRRHFLDTEQGSNNQECRRQEREYRAIVQISLIVGSFYFGYLPIAIVSMHKLNDEDKTTISAKTFLFLCEYLCLRLSECLNPIFYNVASRKLWKETQQLFFAICKPFRNKNQARRKQSASTSCAVHD